MVEEHGIVLRYYITLVRYYITLLVRYYITLVRHYITLAYRVFSREQQCPATQDFPDIQLLLY